MKDEIEELKSKLNNIINPLVLFNFSKNELNYTIIGDNERKIEGKIKNSYLITAINKLYKGKRSNATPNDFDLVLKIANRYQTADQA